LGVSTDTVYRETTATLPPESTLLLYTDGLIERRNESLSVSRDKLLHTVADLDSPSSKLRSMSCWTRTPSTPTTPRPGVGVVVRFVVGGIGDRHRSGGYRQRFRRR
jgi:Stage II sporulation protein E (SpoIIE)